MTHDAMTSHNSGGCVVVLPDRATAEAAIAELQGSVVFDKRIILEILLQRPHVRSSPNLQWGWFASTKPNPEDADFRGPFLAPPRDLFAPVREQRAVTFANIPSFQQKYTRTRETMYELLHNYNVTSLGPPLQQRGTRNFGVKFPTTFIVVYFASRHEADDARSRFDGYVLEGQKLNVREWYLPMKYLGVSWESGYKGEHYSGRDQGSAVGTNFEEVGPAKLFSMH